jgi:hypothetical protein
VAETYVEASRLHNKPSSVDAKETTLRLHIVPALGDLRLDQVTPSPGLSGGRAWVPRSVVGETAWDDVAARHYQRLFRKSKRRSPGR